MKKIRIALMLALVLSLLVAPAALAQTDELSLSMSRDWGYGGFNNDIQGTFSMHVSGPADLARVEFYIDDVMIGEDAESPFALQFVTDSYDPGLHRMSAIGYSSGGSEYHSNVISATFLSAEEASKATGGILIPVLVVVGLAILLSAVGPLLMGRKGLENLPPGAERKYGFRGGAICPKCQRPFAMHIFSLNLGFSKLERCPYCGKWSVVRAQSMEKLRAAEQAELERAGTGQAVGESDEEKLRKDLDDSKYQGM